MRNNYEAFQEAGAEIVALAVASLSSVERNVVNLLNLPYPVLADPDHQVSEDYGVYNVLGDGLAAPAVFVIDTDGEILWSHVGSGPSDRPSANTILKNLP